MNVFHKVLVKIYEITGGKDSVEVDLVDLLKKEGFFPSIDSIYGQLQDESWITVAGRQHVVKITHWGTQEAKRVLSSSPKSVDEVAKGANRLLNEGRELIALLEGFVENRDAGSLDKVDKRLAELNQHSKEIRTHL